MGLCIPSKKQVKPKNSLTISKIVTTSLCQVPIRSIYKFGQIIGSGHFGIVRIATFIGTNSKVAIKSIPKSSISYNSDRLRTEIEILVQVDHPNIIRLIETYEDEKFIYIVMEYCSGGELFAKIIEAGHFDENQSKFLLKKILMAVNHLHLNNIVHRDIKPENFLFESDDKDAELKLVDFGLSNKFGKKFKNLHSKVGTPYYIAPEVLSGSYSNKCDLWSVGIIMYTMMSGDLPFFSDTQSEIFRQILIGKYQMKDEIWNNISPEARNLIQRLMCVDPAKRLSASEALAHPWFISQSPIKFSIDAGMLKALQDYRKISLFQKEALMILIKHLSIHELKELNESFLSLDQYKNGVISIQLLSESLKNSSWHLAQKEIDELIQSIDVDRNGTLNYSEFLAATLSSKLSLQEEIIWLTFMHFDVERKGFITATDIEEALSRQGHKLGNKGIEQMLYEIGKRRTDKITYEEFLNIFLNIKPTKTL
ncbi:unnamed protein product [Blepharisma stoltei]|uniref:non-specific serine/threonine protein kinase n=1 Tax=Blepharisma stoltei TaxID=1481888 RepID=A0AAU9JH95_9CILI|nr:unnamed protein product [Blepharisma stoltei]